MPVMSMPKTVQSVPSTFCFATQIRERKGGISGETQEQKYSYWGKIKPDFDGGGRVFQYRRTQATGDYQQSQVQFRPVHWHETVDKAEGI